MPRLCYAVALASEPPPTIDGLVTRLRAAALSALSASLGAVAYGGCRLLDHPSSVAAVAGGSLILGVALVVDALRVVRGAAQPMQDVRADVQRLRTHVEELHARLDVIEAALISVRVSVESGHRRSVADATGKHPAAQG